MSGGLPRGEPVCLTEEGDGYYLNEGALDYEWCLEENEIEALTQKKELYNSLLRNFAAGDIDRLHFGNMPDWENFLNNSFVLAELERGKAATDAATVGAYNAIRSDLIDRYQYKAKILGSDGQEFVFAHPVAMGPAFGKIRRLLIGMGASKTADTVRDLATKYWEQEKNYHPGGRFFQESEVWKRFGPKPKTSAPKSSSDYQPPANPGAPQNAPIYRKPVFWAIVGGALLLLGGLVATSRRSRARTGY